MLLALTIINLINAIIQTASGFNGLRILSSIMLGICYSILMTFLVYAAYRGYLVDERKLLHYKIGQIAMLIVLFLALILHVLSWNGIIRMSHVFSEEEPFAGTMCILEFLYTFALGGLMTWNLVMVFKTPKP